MAKRNKTSAAALVDVHSASIEFVALGKMAVSGRIQRELKPARVDHLKANFDLEDFGVPVLNVRDHTFYIIDGQHRVEALKLFLGEGWEIQKIECRVFRGLTEAEEAEKFLRLNDALAVSAFDKFKNAVTAHREIETRISRIVSDENLCISRDKVPGAIGAVGTLVRVYNRADGEVLRRALRIIRDAFGDAGFEALVIDGIGHLCQRYNGALDEANAVMQLSKTHGGVKGLLGRAENVHQQTGNSHAQCVAAAAVELLNAKTGMAKRLPSWWKKTSQESEGISA